MSHIHSICFVFILDCHSPISKVESTHLHAGAVGYRHLNDVMASCCLGVVWALYTIPLLQSHACRADHSYFQSFPVGSMECIDMFIQTHLKSTRPCCTFFGNYTISTCKCYNVLLSMFTFSHICVYRILQICMSSIVPLSHG